MCPPRPSIRAAPPRSPPTTLASRATLSRLHSHPRFLAAPLHCYSRAPSNCACHLRLLTPSSTTAFQSNHSDDVLTHSGSAPQPSEHDMPLTPARASPYAASPKEKEQRV